MLLNSADLTGASIGHSWLQGLEIQPEMAQAYGFSIKQRSCSEIVHGLSWIMSLTGPSMIAVDQIDAIITAYNMSAGSKEEAGEEEKNKAQSIVELFANGLMELHDRKGRAVTVVACLEDTWEIIRKKATKAAPHRFHDIIPLKPITSKEVAEIIVSNRLSPAYAELDFQPSYPTWPFRPEAFDKAINVSPRVLLMKCEEHRRKCLMAREVSELTSFTKAEQPPTVTVTDLDPLFEQARATVNFKKYLDPQKEDELHGELLYDVLRVYARQINGSNDIDLSVDGDLDQQRPALHGRLRFIHRGENDREEHYCFRVLNLDHAVAFQTRLKAAVTASGIDRDLSFRRLFILRNSPAPSGKVTAQRVSEFENDGGRFLPLGADDLRTMVALKQMLHQAPDGFDDWLKERRPLCDTVLFRDAGLCEVGQPVKISKRPLSSPVTAQSSIDAPLSTIAPAEQSPVENKNAIPVGIAADASGSAYAIPLDMLPRHTAILAGSGSGKTVLLRRIIEEAVLQGIPAIVLDTNNDLARLGDRWPERPSAFSEQDAEKAARYHECAEVVIWTPRISGGNPLVLASLPDFSSIRDEPDELDRAVHMAAATLTPVIGATGVKGPLKEGVLVQALKYFATRSNGDLQSFTSLLSELPEGISDIDDAKKMARDMAMMLKAAMAKNPLLADPGTALDPEMLISAAQAGKTRVSVINFSGLPSDDARQAFVNQLQMALFSFIKKNPTPPDRPLTALYIMDEAKNFAPAIKTTPCKESTLSLVAQARKYGLGMVFATQAPKDIDNKIINSSTTQFYGRMNAPVTITATRDLMRAKGGDGDDIGKLGAGEFYFTTEGMGKPVKINTPLCLSHHPQSPLSEDEVVSRAARTRPA
ncbi:MAG: ATP-binding protein [Hyphomicrobiaceae bacterium]|nr:ATP-binding protein [Hyphomicrobiaceae bacterium]